MSPPRPDQRRTRIAATAAVCTAAAMATGWAAGSAGLGAVGSPGALAALYGRHGDDPRGALLVVGAGAGALAASTAAGALAAGDAWTSVAVAAGWAVLCTLGCLLISARPPGIAMLVLACAVDSGLPAGPAIQYAGVVLAVGGMVTVPATALSFADRRRCGGHAVARADWRAELRRLPRSPGPRMAARTGTAVLLAGGTAVITGLDHAYWGMAAAAAVLGQGTYAAAANRRALARGCGDAARRPAGRPVAGGPSPRRGGSPPPGRLDLPVRGSRSPGITAWRWSSSLRLACS